MKTATTFAALAAATLMLAGCGSSERASEGATADSVEMPAEEALSSTTAMPSDMPTIIATDEGMDTAGAMPSAAPSDAAEAATRAAEANL